MTLPQSVQLVTVHTGGLAAPARLVFTPATAMPSTSKPLLLPW